METPLFGLGLGGAEAALTRFVDQPAVLAPIWSHNDYVQLVAELGLPVTSLLLGALVVFLVSFYKDIRQRRRDFDPSERVLQRAALLGVLTAALHAFVDFHLRVPLIGFTFLILVALIVNQGPLLVTSMRPR